jgi:hypothetical protein
MNRVLVFVALCTVCVLATAGYALYASQRSQVATAVASDVSASPETLQAVTAQPHVMFLFSPTGDQYKRVAVAALDAPEQHYLTPLQCQRVYAGDGQGLCLGNNYSNGVMSAYNAYTFDSSFQPQFTFQQAGVPSRVRVAPDGSFGSTTVFVTGHSYTDSGFSTATTLIDMQSGATVGNLEQFTVLRDGVPFQAPDFNFWGVTFARDSNRFYATLSTAGKIYLVEGDLAARRITVLREGVECPSLSPDNTRLIYKRLTSSGPVRTWGWSVLDLATLQDRPLAAETRNVDDQAEWLDDSHILYALPDEGPPATIATHVWVASVDIDEEPRIFLRYASSPAVVR